jgi:hypothetical protein
MEFEIVTVKSFHIVSIANPQRESRVLLWISCALWMFTMAGIKDYGIISI